MEQADADRLAAAWVDAWNARDLGRVLQHYDDDFVMSSPIIAEIINASGELRGKEAVKAYWQIALSRVENVRFDLIAALLGIDSVTIIYNGPRGLSVEVLKFGGNGKVSAASAHYVGRPRALAR